MSHRARPFARRALVPLALTSALAAVPAPASAGKRPPGASPVVAAVGGPANGNPKGATSRSARVRGRKFRRRSG